MENEKKSIENINELKEFLIEKVGYSPDVIQAKYEENLNKISDNYKSQTKKWKEKLALTSTFLFFKGLKNGSVQRVEMKMVVLSVFRNTYLKRKENLIKEYNQSLETFVEKYGEKYIIKNNEVYSKGKYGDFRIQDNLVSDIFGVIDINSKHIPFVSTVFAPINSEPIQPLCKYSFYASNDELNTINNSEINNILSLKIKDMKKVNEKVETDKLVKIVENLPEKLLMNINDLKNIESRNLELPAQFNNLAIFKGFAFNFRKAKTGTNNDIISLVENMELNEDMENVMVIVNPELNISEKIGEGSELIVLGNIIRNNNDDDKNLPRVMCLSYIPINIVAPVAKISVDDMVAENNNEIFE